jgi:hypothetical protein
MAGAIGRRLKVRVILCLGDDAVCGKDQVFEPSHFWPAADMDSPTSPSRLSRPLTIALLCALIPSLLAFVIAPVLPEELKKVVYGGAATLLFGGLLGGVLKLQLDEVVAAKRRREDAADFVANVLSDLKGVYDRVERARTLVPAHKSAKTYGDEMRGLIEARVQLRNVIRALERRAEGIDNEARKAVTRPVGQMAEYLDTLVGEFRDNYKPLSDDQRGYEARAEALLKSYAETTGQANPPELPNFVWTRISKLPVLADFIGERGEYKKSFEEPLDYASEVLRDEHARILRIEGGFWASGI